MPGRLSTVFGRGSAGLVVACALGATVVHVVGWGFAAVVALPDATMYWLEPASVAVLVLGGLITWAAQSLSRAARRRVVLAGLAATMLSFVTFTIPPLRFHDQNYMNDGADNIESREKFDRRFPIVVRSEMNFHSHLGDLVMRALDRRFGATPKGTARAYATLSSLAGAMFVIELLLVGWWHGFSRRICRYVGLAIASPLALLYSGFYELGYLAVCASSLPLLAVRRRSDLRETGAALCAGLLQGFHTALHGFGLIGLAGGALSLIVERGTVVRRGVRTLAYASAGVAMYLGWVFIYVVGMHISIVVENALTGFGLRHFFETVVLDRRYAYPVFSANGLAEIGLIGLLAGVPLFVLGCVKAPRGSLPTAAAYALPGLVFLIVWWPPGAPHNVDLLLTAFPGLFVGAWLLARRSRQAWSGLAMMAALHVLFWTNAGSRMMPRTWLEP